MSLNNEWLSEIIAKTLIEKDIDVEKISNLEGIIYNVIENTLPELSEILINSLKENSSDMLEEYRYLRQEFEARLSLRWYKAFNLLETLIVISVEIGSKLNEEYRQQAEDKTDYIFEALIRIHSRACQVSYEILCLLRGGFADGAFARWRTLHELSVLSNFIATYDNETAKRYLDYEIIENYYEMLEYQKFCNRLDHEPLSEKEINNLSDERDRLLLLHGEEFDKPYGWVAKILPEKKRNFKGIEEESNLDHLRPYYKLACNNIHLGPKGNNFSLALVGDERRADTLPCGASNYGLADPGQNTSISLTQITASLITINANYERLLAITAMMKLDEEIRNTFVSIQWQIEEEVSTERED